MAASSERCSTPVLAVVRERGARVLAVAARGPVAAWFETVLEQDPTCDTTTLPLEAEGDLALAVRARDTITVRVSGDARVLALQADGRAVWIESGRTTQFPVDQVERLVLLTGIYPDQVARGELVSWLAAGASHDALRRLWGQWLDSVVTLYGVDHQRSDVGETFDEPLDPDDLFDFLESHAALDERATPAVVRREHSPSAAPLSNPVEVGPSVFVAPAITTTTHTGPPFRPVLFVNTVDNPYPDRVTSEDEPTPIPLPRRLARLPVEVTNIPTPPPDVDHPTPTPTPTPTPRPPTSTSLAPTLAPPLHPSPLPWQRPAMVGLMLLVLLALVLFWIV